MGIFLTIFSFIARAIHRNGIVHSKIGVKKNPKKNTLLLRKVQEDVIKRCLATLRVLEEGLLVALGEA